jgi:HlyD family secretion protein
VDKKIKRKSKRTLKLLSFSGAGILAIIVFVFAFNSRSSTYKTEMRKLSTAKVLVDNFQEEAVFMGSVEPLKTYLLDASEGGLVEKLFAEQGNMVDSGQLLIQLSNTSLRLDFMNRETQIVEQINNLRSTRITLDQNKRQVQEQLVEIEYQLLEQQRQFTIDSSLFADGAISKADYDASLARLTYLNKRQILLQERSKTDELYRASQLNRIDQSIVMMERNLNAILKNLEALAVRAPATGQLNSFDHEIGETKNRGENLGRIDILDGYKISAQVDQYFLNKIQLNQKGSIESGGRNYTVTVSRILPTVVNSQFEIELIFADTNQNTNHKTNRNLRRGQNFQVHLALSASKESVLIPRGAFSQSNSGNVIYVLNSDRTEAEKRQVTLGTQNPKYIEVLSGLEPGEEVITSSYSVFGNAEKILIKS